MVAHRRAARIRVAWVILAAFAAVNGCSRAPDVLTLVTYNVQNLFDATESGTEYTEFTPAAGWNADSYYKRLIRLGHVLGDLAPSSPDIIAMQEVESPQVVSDLLRDFLRGRYQSVMSPASESSIRVALVSRHPLISARIHRSVAVAVSPGAAPRPPVTIWQGREIVDACIDVGRTVSGRNSAIRIIVCHWKSQSGGERESEPQRIQSAALLASLLLSSDDSPPTLIVGDLNEDVDEYARHDGAYPTALMPEENPAGEAGSPAGTSVAAVPGRARSGRVSITVVSTVAAAGRRSDRIAVFSPWLANDVAGSYHHAGRWERLDQVLVLPGSSGSVDARLDIIDDPELLTNDGRPFRYDPRTGYGYSDHLPVVVQIRFPPSE